MWLHVVTLRLPVAPLWLPVVTLWCLVVTVWPPVVTAWLPLVTLWCPVVTLWLPVVTLWLPVVSLLHSPSSCYVFYLPSVFFSRFHHDIRSSGNILYWRAFIFLFEKISIFIFSSSTTAGENCLPEAGRRQTLQQHFLLCRVLWKLDYSCLVQWLQVSQFFLSFRFVLWSLLPVFKLSCLGPFTSVCFKRQFYVLCVLILHLG